MFLHMHSLILEINGLILNTNIYMYTPCQKKNCANLFFAPCLSNMIHFNKNWKDCPGRNS